MKKLIVAVVATMLGIVANAAAVTWAVTNVQASPAAAATEGWVIQLFDSSVAYDYAKVVSGEIEARFTGSTVANGTTGTFKGQTKETNAAVAGEQVDLYMVIYDAATIADAKYYIVSDVAGKKVNDLGSDITISFGSMAATTTANKFLNSQWTETVPEPTSGLLLLLGMAGLALRRRRA